MARLSIQKVDEQFYDKSEINIQNNYEVSDVYTFVMLCKIWKTATEKRRTELFVY